MPSSFQFVRADSHQDVEVFCGGAGGDLPNGRPVHVPEEGPLQAALPALHGPVPREPGGPQEVA